MLAQRLYGEREKAAQQIADMFGVPRSTCMATSTARVAPGSWVHVGGTQRGDVALLQLDEPAGCGTRTTLWRAPPSGGTVSAYGFPQTSRMIGMRTDAELSGFSGGRDGWGLLNLVRPGSPWIEQGYSGAGVVVRAQRHRSGRPQRPPASRTAGLPRGAHPVTTAAAEAIDGFRNLVHRPDEVEVSFGVVLDGKLGGLLASANAGAHLDITLRWNGSSTTPPADAEP